MSTQTQTPRHDETVVGFMLGAVLIFCLFTAVVLIGIF